MRWLFARKSQGYYRLWYYIFGKSTGKTIPMRKTRVLPLYSFRNSGWNEERTSGVETEREREGGKKKSNSSASGERVIGELGGTGSCYTAERDGRNGRGEILHGGRRTHRNHPAAILWTTEGIGFVVGKSCVRHSFVKRRPAAKREVTRWKRTPRKRRHAEFTV